MEFRLKDLGRRIEALRDYLAARGLVQGAERSDRGKTDAVVGRGVCGGVTLGRND
jgi:hypothetical protein